MVIVVTLLQMLCDSCKVRDALRDCSECKRKQCLQPQGAGL